MRKYTAQRRGGHRARRGHASGTVWVENRKETSMSSFSLQDNAKLESFEQNYGDDPLADRESDLYRGEFVMGFVEKWDELIDWDARAKSEGQFFIDILHARGKESVLDAATGTGFHSVRLTEAGFDVISVDGSAAMLAKAFENAQKRWNLPSQRLRNHYLIMTISVMTISSKRRRQHERPRTGGRRQAAQTIVDRIARDDRRGMPGPHNHQVMDR